MEPSDDPFASLSPKNSVEPMNSKSRAVNPSNASSSPPTDAGNPVLSAEDVDIVVERVVSRVVRDSVVPLVERVRLSTESKLNAVLKKLTELTELMESVDRRQKEIGDDVETLRAGLREVASDGAANEGVTGGEGVAGSGEPTGDEPADEGEPEASTSSIDDVEALRAGLQALMRENEVRMKLLDARLAMPPPPPPPPPPARGYVPPGPAREVAPPPPPPPGHVPPPPSYRPLPSPQRPLHHPQYQGQPPHQQQFHEQQQQPSSSAVPVERVIDDIAVMGFSREEVRNVLRELTAQGRPVDMNVVLDRLGALS